MTASDAAVYVLIVVGLALVAWGKAAGVDAIALTGVGCWVASAALLLGRAGPRRGGPT